MQWSRVGPQPWDWRLYNKGQFEDRRTRAPWGHVVNTKAEVSGVSTKPQCQAKDGGPVAQGAEKGTGGTAGDDGDALAVTC